MCPIIRTIARLLLGVMLVAIPLTAASAKADTLNGHTVVLDGSGKIIPWTTDPTQGYDEVVNLAWNYLLNSVPIDSQNQKPYYYSYSYIDPVTQDPSGPHDPAGMYAMQAESALKYYGYSGNISAVHLAEDIASALLTNGMTPSGWNWANVPYASGNAGSLIYQGAAVGNTSGVGDGTGVIEPDKVGEMGFAWLQLYRFNGNTLFRDAAIAAADALASHVRTGTSTQSPWPFRVYAQTGVVREDYCADVIGPITLFDGLIGLGLGNTAAYQTARQTAWTWLMTYPMQNDVWANYFEDVPIQSNTDNVNQYNAMMTARYILAHPENDANWETDVRGLIAWVESIFAVPSYGANTISEQIVFLHPMGSHSSRYASVNALLYEKTGDLAAKEKAYRSLNWATYMARPDGVVIDGPDVGNQWFTDGYGDYVRCIMTGLGAVPEWAPQGQNHLVRSSSIVKSISYLSSSISYTTVDGNSIEVLRVNFFPTSVTVDGQVLSQRTDLNQAGWTFDPSLNVLRIRHDIGTNVVISQSLTSIAVTPGNATITIGMNLQFTATLTNADGSTQNISSMATWASSSTSVATINSAGFATTINPGSTTISATLGGVTGSTNLTVQMIADQTPPTTPSNLTAVAFGPSRVNLNWTASTDPVGVAGYRVIRNGSQIATSIIPSYSDTTVSAGTTYNYIVRAYDTAGNVSLDSNIASVTTPAMAPAPVLDKAVTTKQATGSSSISSPGISTAQSNELLVAFIASDGPATGGSQRITAVTGGGLTWTLRSRANAQAGTAEIWTAPATNVATNVIVAATRLTGSYQGMMTVAAFQGASLTVNGAVANASALSGAPMVSLTTTQPNSLVWAVGDDWDRAVARTVGANQTKQSEYLAPTGDTFWVQYVTAPISASGALTTVSCTAPTNDRWNLAAAEILPATISIPTDTTPPTVTAFTIPAIASTLTVSITSFNASDNNGVTGYLLNEVATAPSPTAGGWSATAPITYTFTTTGNKTLYAWAKDAAGNVSASRSANITIDTTPPTVTAFTIPAIASTLTISITSFNASDNNGVTGYLVNEVATAPSPTSSGWSATAPLTYTFTTTGNKTLYAWAKDAAGNVSASASASVVVTIVDTIPPTVTAFTIPAIASMLTVSITSFNASDNNGVIGYLVNEVATAPSPTASGWSATAPLTYTFTTTGNKTLFAWAKDAVGNVSASRSANTTIDTTPPTVTAFTVPAIASTLTISITSFNASDNNGVTGYLVNEVATAPSPTSSGWSATAPITYTFTTTGNKTLYAWAKDAAGNVSASRSANTTIDTTPPTVTVFTVPAIASTLTVSITSFVASDNNGVTGYMVNELSTAPSPTASGWSATAPLTYTFATTGNKTLYAWAKDAAGNVSASRSANTTVDTTLPTTPTNLTAIAIGPTQVNLNWTASTDNVGVAGYRVIRNGSQIATSIIPSYSDTTVAAGTTYNYIVRAYDTAGNISLDSNTASVTTPAIAPVPVLDKTVTTKQATGSGSISSPSISTAQPNELLVALIASDGPATGGSQRITAVTGGGLTWTLRSRANAQPGTAEIWTAPATNVATNVIVTATRLTGSYQGMMTVAAFQGASLTVNGAVANASALSGAPMVSLTTTQPNSLVWAVGDDWDRAVARTVGVNQTKQSEYLAPAGDTFWVQYVTAPIPAAGVSTTISCSAPTNDRWNLAAVEILRQ